MSVKVCELYAVTSGPSMTSGPEVGRGNGPETRPGAKPSERGGVAPNLPALAGTPALKSGEEVRRIFV